jgi:hypothetical protein
MPKAGSGTPAMLYTDPKSALGEEIINVVPVGEPSAQDATNPSVDAQLAASSDEEAKGE